MTDELSEGVEIYPPKEIGDFWIKAEWTEHYCQFKCVECIANDGPGTTPEYPKDWGAPDRSLVQDPTVADTYLSGAIKWDGCADLYFEEHSDGAGFHFCGKREAMRKTAKLIDRLYQIAANVIKHWNGKE